jgi:hypothetical protein
MKRVVFLALIITVFVVSTKAEEVPEVLSTPALGMKVSLPLITTGVTPAMALIQFLAETPLTQDIAVRLDLRLYLSTVLRLDLTSVQGTTLLFLNQGPASFYLGAGAGVFPYESSVFVLGIDPGLLWSVHVLGGMRIRVELFSIFTELSYEMMPQPVIDGTGVISSLQLGVGGMVYF